MNRKSPLLGELLAEVEAITVPAVTLPAFRAAALTVADRLGPDCRDVLEALGITSYEGNNTTAGHVTRARRRGVLA